MLRFCPWWNPWCRGKARQEEIIKRAIDETTTSLASDIAKSVTDEIRKENIQRNVIQSIRGGK
ncbi:hypothetical protein [Enterococcus sp. AZ177]|uniref:hypothetical protein n=1 Tax=unclassified Enterococcus TaxID=2608891 RepID=UPI003D2FF6F4